MTMAEASDGRAPVTSWKWSPGPTIRSPTVPFVLCGSTTYTRLTTKPIFRSLYARFRVPYPKGNTEPYY